MKTLEIKIEIDDDEYEEFLNREDVQGNINAWLFGELCQNQGLGFITHFAIDEA